MVSSLKWTKAENLAIYLYMELYPQEKVTTLVMYLKESKFIAPMRSDDAIAQHIYQLRNLKEQLHVPDPVHDFNDGICYKKY